MPTGSSGGSAASDPPPPSEQPASTSSSTATRDLEARPCGLCRARKIWSGSGLRSMPGSLLGDLREAAHERLRPVDDVVVLDGLPHRPHPLYAVPSRASKVHSNGEIFDCNRLHRPLGKVHCLTLRQ